MRWGRHNGAAENIINRRRTVANLNTKEWTDEDFAQTYRSANEPSANAMLGFKVSGGFVIGYTQSGPTRPSEVYTWGGVGISL